jgi:hypothetical protein
MSQTIPDLVRPTLKDYLSMLDKQLRGLAKAVYLEGSIALGGFNRRFSDIDFVSCLDHQPGPAETDTLRNIHKVIKDRHSQWQMQGSYIQLADLRCWEATTRPDLTYHAAKLQPGGHFEPQSVEGWVLKNHGIVLMGPDPQDLPFTVDWDSLIIKMRQNLNTYWLGWTRRPDRLIALLSDWGIQWAVLGVLRQFYSFRENTITTKSKAGEYALAHVPDRWQRLIRESLDIREGKRISAYRFNVIRAGESVRFLRFIIKTCNANLMDAAQDV